MKKTAAEKHNEKIDLKRRKELNQLNETCAELRCRLQEAKQTNEKLSATNAKLSNTLARVKIVIGEIPAELTNRRIPIGGGSGLHGFMDSLYLQEDPLRKLILDLTTEELERLKSAFELSPLETLLTVTGYLSSDSGALVRP